MRDDEHRDESDVEEQAPMEEGGEHDGAAPEGEVHSRHDVERVKRALRGLHTNLGHPGVKEMVASKLAIQEARRMHCDICAENVQPKLPRPANPRQVLDFNERVGLDILSCFIGDAARSVKCLNFVCHGTLFRMIVPLWLGTTGLDVRLPFWLMPFLVRDTSCLCECASSCWVCCAVCDHGQEQEVGVGRQFARGCVEDGSKPSSTTAPTRFPGGHQGRTPPRQPILQFRNPSHDSVWTNAWRGQPRSPTNQGSVEEGTRPVARVACGRERLDPTLKFVLRSRARIEKMQAELGRRFCNKHW